MFCNHLVKSGLYNDSKALNFVIFTIDYLTFFASWPLLRSINLQVSNILTFSEYLSQGLVLLVYLSFIIVVYLLNYSRLLILGIQDIFKHTISGPGKITRSQNCWRLARRVFIPFECRYFTYELKLLQLF